MEILKVIIVDDELQGRNNLLYLLKSFCPEVDVIGKAGSAADAKKMIYKLHPDVVFLDIGMPKVNGFELLESLTEINFLLVFVSAHAEFGIQAVKANAVDYLLKPISIKELQNSIKKLIEIRNNKAKHPANNKNCPHDKIIISHFTGFSIIDVCDLIRLEADNNYTNLYLRGNAKVTASKTMKHFEEMLPEEKFFRVHRSKIVNIDFIKELSYEDGGLLVLKDGVKIPIPKNKLHSLIEKVKSYSRTNN
jgi:two-component system, LytTR family, response regulator